MKNLLAPLLLSLLPLVACAADPTLIPIDAFVSEPTYSQPRLSPDGKHIALNVRVMRNGRMTPTMSVYSLPELKLVSTIALSAFQVPVDFSWLTNSRLVLLKGVEVGLRMQPRYTGEVLAVDLDGSRQSYLFGYKGFTQSAQGGRYGDDYGWGSISHIPQNRNGHVFLNTQMWESEHTMLYDVDSVSSIRKLLADIPMKSLTYHEQHDGTPRFASGLDEQNIPVLFRFDDASGKWKKLDTSVPGARYFPISFSADDSALYVSNSADGGPYNILREDMVSGKRTPVASDPLGSITHIAFTSKPSIPFAVSTSVGVPRPHYIDENHPDAKLHKTLSATFPNDIVTFINFSDDGQKLLFSVRSDREPGSYYLYDRGTAEATILFSNMDGIDPDQMASRLPISFTARDGLQLTGYLTMPRNPGGAKLPLVLLPHGGPFDVDDDWFFDTDAQFLASRGYAVLQVNFRGSSGRGRKFVWSGYREFGGKIMNDLVDGVKWANKRVDIDANRVCVYGISFGGYAALMLPIREPGMFKCSIGYSGLYNLSSVYGQDNLSGDKQGMNYLINTLGNDKAQLDKQSPSKLASQVKVKVLLAHGGNDKVTEPAQAVQMFEALKKADNPAEWIFEPDEGHGFYDARRRKNFYERLEQFLGRNIGNGAIAP